MVINESVASLLLDESNPRFPDQVAGQDEAITALLKDAAPKLLSLAEDIANEGSLNPTELPVVVEEDDGLVVIEGNRRLAALKLLKNPDLSAEAGAQLDMALVKKFRKIQQIGTGPELIDVFQADTREAARHWIELRHTGENGGVGVLGWQSWQTNNYRRRRGSQADRATLFCQAVEADFAEDASILSNVATVRRTRLTTLGRLVADPDVRRDFGFQFSVDEILFDYETDNLRAGIGRILKDLSARPGVTVTDIKSKAQRLEYISDRSDLLPDRATRLVDPRRPGEHPLNSAVGSSKNRSEIVENHTDYDDASGGAGADRNVSGPTAINHSGDSGQPNSGGGGANGVKSRSQPPENVIFKSLKLPHLHVRIRELLAMTQKLNIVDSAPICGILVRVILELAVTEAIQLGVVAGASESDQVKKKIRRTLLAIDPECENPRKRDKSLEMAWTKTQDNDAMAVQSLNAFVHNVHGLAAPTEVRALSLTFRPFLEKIDQLIANGNA